MVAAGIPAPRDDHARAVALIALDMLEAVRAMVPIGRCGLEVRIGINSGPVVAGVIGRKRFLYDLWGDAVNIADRMQTHGDAGPHSGHAGDVRAPSNDEFVSKRGARSRSVARGTWRPGTWSGHGWRQRRPPWQKSPPHGTNREEGPVTRRRFPPHRESAPGWAGLGAKWPGTVAPLAPPHGNPHQIPTSESENRARSDMVSA